VQHASSSTGTPQEIVSGVYRLELPLTLGEAPNVNAYAITSDDGLLLVDAGYNSDEARESLARQLALLGAQMDDVRAVFLTHLHADHIGLITHVGDGHARVMAVPPVEGVRGWPEEMGEWLTANGVPLEETTPPRRRILDDGYRPPDALLADGIEIAWGDFRLRVVRTPGHSPGHACLHEASTGLLFAGDHVLEYISTHIGLLADQPGDDPLGDYLRSLERVKGLDVDQVLPGHGRPFPDLVRRVDQLFSHHAERFNEILAAIQGGASTVVEIASRVSWLDQRDGWNGLSRMGRTMAISETLAHLRHLERTSRVERQAQGAIFNYLERQPA
jgi:glyoxylase-like metal-dependent hydrolase (beta-lactamase superfamily II)